MRTILKIPNQGDIGAHVVELQTALSENGFKIRIDGVFGPATKKAVSAFQKSKGLEGSGIIGPKTLQLLQIEVKAVNPVTMRESRTRDLQGRKKRYLHPTLRLLIETKLFESISFEEFLKLPPNLMAVEVCKALLALDIKEEGGNNRGRTVGLIQAIIGEYIPNGNGDAWCMSADQCVIAFVEDALGIESPVLDSESVTQVGEHALKIPGLTANGPEPGSSVCARHGNSWKGHVWRVIHLIDYNYHRSCEGNTGPDGGRDGDGYYSRIRHHYKNGDLHTMCFVRIYPNNDPQWSVK